MNGIKKCFKKKKTERVESTQECCRYEKTTTSFLFQMFCFFFLQRVIHLFNTVMFFMFLSISVKTNV